MENKMKRIEETLKLLKGVGFEQTSSTELKGHGYFHVYLGNFRIVFRSKRFTSSVAYEDVESFLKKKKIKN